MECDSLDKHPIDLAYLEDRILMNSGEPQKYGTQFQIGKDGVKHLYKLQDKENVNAMRSSINLPPLSEAEILSAK
jgi:hypothetical protein